MTEYVNHFGAVRIRIVGSGNLLSKLQSLDDVYELDLSSAVLSATSNKSITILSNFMQTKAKFRMEINEIDEYFKVDNIMIYIKPTFTSFPQ
jgi:hypothetical protein